MKLKQLTAGAITNKGVLVRVDLNVPLKEQGGVVRVADATRLELAAETIRFLQPHHAKVILLTHLGRPAGTFQKKLSTQVLAEPLAKILSLPVLFCPDRDPVAIKTFVSKQTNGSIILLENTRFFAGEQTNDPKLAQQFAALGDVFVNEAFSTAHRAHMSVVGLAAVLPSYAGLAFEREVETLFKLLSKPKRPFVVVVGGAKISDKVEAVAHLAQIANVVLVGGGVANNFLAADGYDTAKSYLQDCPVDAAKKNSSYIHFASKLIAKTKNERIIKDGYIPLPKILYPTDVLAAPAMTSKQTCVVDLYGQNGNGKQSPELMYLDIGPKTARLFKEIILSAGTVFWNGPMGVFEEPSFASGTEEIARAVAKSGAHTVVGGGDTLAAINQFGLGNRFDYVSAAGGAALEFLAGKMLPGIKPLLQKESQ